MIEKTNKNKNIIVLSGKKGSGKNTVADMINNYLLNKQLSKGIPYLPVTDFFYKEMSFAQPIKDILSIVARESVGSLDDNKDILFSSRLNTRLLVDKTPRDFYKLIADLFKENIDNNIWVHILLDEIRHSENENIIITDMRFKNEFKSLKESGYNIIFVRIKRKSKNDPSQSEVDLDDVPDKDFNYIIENDSDEKSLYNKVEIFCEKFKI